MKYEDSLKEIEKRVINGLFDFVRNGSNLQSTSKDYMFCYSEIYNLTDYGMGKELIDYHNKIIEKVSTECYEKINDLINIDFIDSFVLYNGRLNKFFYSMSRIFKYISTNTLMGTDDRYNVRIYKQDDISEFSMDIYKTYFFDKLQNKLFTILNEFLIKEEREGNMIYRNTIKTIMKIINDMDIIKPKITKNKDSSASWIETNTNNLDNKFIYQKRWFENFKEKTIKYVQEKADKGINNSTIPEYISNSLKYINEEYERQNSYINKIFHNDINNINYEYLIKKNMNKISDMNTGIKNMFKTNKKDELYGVYLLFSLDKKSLDLLQNIFGEFIKEQGLILYNNKKVSNESKDIENYIAALIWFKMEIDEYINLCFEKNKDFQKKENEEFRFLMKDISPEILPNYEEFYAVIGLNGN